MTEKTLFGIITILLVLILAVGAYAAFKNPVAAGALPGAAVSTVTSAVGMRGSIPATETTTSGSAPTATTTAATDTAHTQAPGTYTMDQIAQHGSATSCYTAIRGFAYDLTPFIDQHPGGSVILSLCGIDGTAGFEAQHGGQRDPERELASLKIGTIVK